MPSLAVYQDEARACSRCRDEGLLFRDDDGRWAYPVLQRNPTGAAGVLVVCEAPNRDDTFDPAKGFLTCDRETDPTGRFMYELITSQGLAMEDLLLTNAALCLPTARAARFPVSARQLRLCRPWLVRLIEESRARVVVTFGGTALRAVARIEPHGLTLRTGTGRIHPWFGRHLLPLYHPSLLGRVSRNESDQRGDIAALGRFLGRSA